MGLSPWASLAVEKGLFWAEEWTLLDRVTAVGLVPPRWHQDKGRQAIRDTSFIYSFAHIQLDTVNLVTSSKSDAEKFCFF